jgi:hypothetical protein
MDIGKPTSINISKLDAAKRELEHAIKLFFNRGDIVVIHLAASSAQKILWDLGKINGIKSFRDELKKYIKPEKLDLVTKTLNKANNFFKHADKDPNGLLPFNPASSEYVIWDAVNLYQGLTSELPGLMVSFRLWFYIKHQDIVLDEKFKEAVSMHKADINLEDKGLFLDLASEYEKRFS